MTQIIKFIDVNADGCGSDVEVLVQLAGEKELTLEIIERIKETVSNYKKENEGTWDTDEVVNAACEYLETEGYACSYVDADATLCF